MHLRWPTGQEYSEAIQSPQTFFVDSALRESIPAVDRLGMPFVSSGNFAYVFKIALPNKEERAIRCFRQFLGDREKRYKAINDLLDKVSIPVLVNFEYDPSGIIVRGQKLPVLVMDWTKGTTLDAYINAVIERKDVLHYLAGQWINIIDKLGTAHISHGDLQHGNIIIQNGQIKLVDYDGMYVESIRSLKACELGHRHYQHPMRSMDYFDLSLDNFSALVIYLSLISLAERPQLWKEFHNGENLIFTRKDFERPYQSEVFKKVKEIGGDVCQLADSLQRYCLNAPSTIPKVGTLVAKKSKLPMWMQQTPEGVSIQDRSREVPTQERRYGRDGLPTTVEDIKVGTLTTPRPIPKSTPTQQPTYMPPSSKPSFDWGTWWGISFRNALGIGAFCIIFIGFWFPFLRNVLVSFGMSRRSSDLSPATLLFYAIICLAVGMWLAKRQMDRPPKVQRQIPSPVPPRQMPSSTPTPTRQTRGTSTTSTTSKTGIVVGSRIRTIYHKPNCEWALQMSARNKINFNSASEARGRGYRPCKVCNP